MENKLKNISILFIAKEKPFAIEAAELIKANIKNPTIVFGKISDPFPEKLSGRRFDYIISYLSPWIVPERLLKNASTASINFHPGPPEYPGIGCTNFAIYNGEKIFGITVHHMRKMVDSGDIIEVVRFPIFDNDTVYSLSQSCYAFIFTSFINLFSIIIHDSSLSCANEQWKRKPYTRQELNELCIITKDMPEHEIRRRVRATTFPNMPGAYIELGGTKFLADLSFSE